MAEPIDSHRSSPGSKVSRTQTSPQSHQPKDFIEIPPEIKGLHVFLQIPKISVKYAKISAKYNHFPPTAFGGKVHVFDGNLGYLEENVEPFDFGEVPPLSSNSSPNLGKNHDHDHHGNHHHKKSVFMRVKEKARKLKKSISGRKHRDDHNSRGLYATPPGSTRPVDDGPENFSTPSFVPTVEPEIDKNGASEKHKNTSNMDRGSTDSTESKLSNLTIGDRDANKPAQQQDKGVSVKEYLLHKLEPGEDERALSQAIQQTISPRRDKMKEAMNTLLGTEEPSQSTANKTLNSELNGSSSSRNAGEGSSTESSNVKTGSLAESSNASHSVESSLSSANVCSTSLSGSGQNQILGSSSMGCSNLKPNSGSNHSDSNPSGSSSSPNVHVDTSANATQASTSTSSHEGTKDGDR